MRKKVLLILSMIIFLVLIFGIFLVKPAFNYISGYLSKSKIVNANILIVEGWLPDYALKLASDEFQKHDYEYIITTGIKSKINYFILYVNGYLIFYPHSKLSGNTEYKEHSLEVEAYSELDGVNRAHFNIYINDSISGNYYADKRKRKYIIKWKGSLSKIDSVLVQFDNDSWGQFGDRNLFVKDIIIDNQIIIPYGNNSAFVETKLSNKHEILSNFNSNAELARNRLISMGIDSSRIKATPGERVKINRTLTSAVAFRNWLKTSNIDIHGINIFSMGIHSRRTWMTYNKLLNEKYEIGIISVPDYLHQSKENRLLKTLRETLGIIYYWIILLPY
jgi:hypothetical protein